MVHITRRRCGISAILASSTNAMTYLLTYLKYRETPFLCCSKQKRLIPYPTYEFINTICVVHVRRTELRPVRPSWLRAGSRNIGSEKYAATPHDIEPVQAVMSPVWGTGAHASSRLPTILVFFVHYLPNALAALDRL